jgi:hypothetical protein
MLRRRSRWLSWIRGRTRSSGDARSSQSLFFFPSISLAYSDFTFRREPTFLDPLAPRNAEFERGDWLKSIIWNANQPYRDFTRINLNLNDTQMLLEVHSGVGPGEFLPSSPSNPPNARSPPVVAPSDIQTTTREVGLDPFNLSNDREYEVTKDTKKRIRQTFGLLEVQHAYPAQKLQLPFVCPAPSSREDHY